MTSILFTDALQVLATFFAAIGLWFTGWQIGTASRVRRVEKVDAVRQKLYEDNEFRDLYYRILYGEFEFKEEENTYDLKIPLARLLSLFDSLSKLVEIGVLKTVDLRLISYEFLVIYNDLEIKKYFDYLDGWYFNRGIAGYSFHSLRAVGERLNDIGYDAQKLSS